MLMVTSILAMKIQNLRVSPVPGEKHELCTQGPYRWIRHPMYTAGLLFCGAFTIGVNTLGTTGLWALLIIVLYAKAKLEEKLWLGHSVSYAPYMEGTKRFVPFLF